MTRIGHSFTGVGMVSSCHSLVWANGASVT